MLPSGLSPEAKTSPEAGEYGGGMGVVAATGHAPKGREGFWVGGGGGFDGQGGGGGGGGGEGKWSWAVKRDETRRMSSCRGVAFAFAFAFATAASPRLPFCAQRSMSLPPSPLDVFGGASPPPPNQNRPFLVLRVAMKE